MTTGKWAPLPVISLGPIYEGFTLLPTASGDLDIQWYPAYYVLQGWP